MYSPWSWFIPCRVTFRHLNNLLIINSAFFWLWLSSTLWRISLCKCMWARMGWSLILLDRLYGEILGPMIPPPLAHTDYSFHLCATKRSLSCLWGKHFTSWNTSPSPLWRVHTQHRQVLEHDMTTWSSAHPTCASRVVYTLSTMI